MTIRCDNAEEYEKLAPMLSARGYRWLSGDNPMKWNPFSGEPKNIKCYINLYSNHIIKYDDNDNYMDAISVETYRIKEGIKMNKFTKADLEDGIIMQTRDNRYYMYFKKFNKGVRYEGHITLKDYNDDLIYTGLSFNLSPSSNDIVAVYNPSDLTSLDFNSLHLKLIWKRPEEVVMTISEIEEKLGIKNLKVVSEKEKDNG